MIVITQFSLCLHASICGNKIWIDHGYFLPPWSGKVILCPWSGKLSPSRMLILPELCCVLLGIDPSINAVIIWESWKKPPAFMYCHQLSVITGICLGVNDRPCDWSCTDRETDSGRTRFYGIVSWCQLLEPAGYVHTHTQLSGKHTAVQ